MKIFFYILFTFIILTSCTRHNYKNERTVGENLKLNYSIYSYKKLFPQDKNVKMYSGIIVLETPDSTLYVNLAETIKNIVLKENLVRGLIFTSKDGYLMEIDSISKTYNEYDMFYLANFDFTTKGLHWKYIINLKDINFNGISSITTQTAYGTGKAIYYKNEIK